METLEAVETQTADTETSPVSETATHETRATVDKEASTTSPDANGSTSSKEQDSKNVLRSSKAAMEILGKDLPEVAPEDQENEGPEKSSEAKPKPEKAGTEKAVVQDEQAAKTAKAETDANVLFHKRPEWAELTTALGEEGAKKARPILRKVLEREVAINAQLEKARPDLEEIKSLKSVVGDEQNWKFYRSVTEGFAKADPKLIPVLEKMLEQIKQRNGLVLQSPELLTEAQTLEQQVKAGTIDQESADRRKKELLELEQGRVTRKQSQAEIEQSRVQRQQEQDQQTARDNTAALDEWETNVRGKYADFGNVTDENDAQHGVSMADQVMAELSARLAAKPAANRQELVATAQRSLEIVERRMKTYAPQPRTMRPVTSESSSRTAKPAPKNFKEAVESASGILFGSQA